MTLALCFNCGHTKFGAICPCDKCGVSSTGDVNLDIAFSDHFMSADTIGRFGGVIQSIQPIDDDPDVRFWVFMRFITDRHGDILRANCPDELADRVDAVYAKSDFPEIEVLPGHSRSMDEGPSTTIPIPAPLVEAYRNQYEFFALGLAAVEVRLRDGRRHRAILMKTADGAELNFRGEHPNLTASDIAAIRETRGCLFSFRRRPWVSINGPV